MTHQRPAVLWLLLLTAGAVRAQAPLLPPGEREPFLRLETGGPTAVVTGLAFSPDGQMLYAAGWDKVVRVWVREPRTGRYLLAPHAYRVPIGPGLDGAINALALSSDGTWLAVGGRGVVRGESGFRDVGLVIPTAIGSLTPERRLDRGLIYVFNTRTQAVRLLRGHRGQVLSLAFAPSRPGQPPLLVSVGQDWDDQTGKYVGAVRLWDLTRDEPQQAFQDHLPDPGNTRPGLVVTANGEADVSAGLAWGDGRFRLWLPRRDAAAVQAQEDGRFNSVAAAQGSLVLTGSMVGYSGRLQVWSLNPFRADPQGQVVFPPQGSVAYFPRALTLLSSKPNGPTDLAAVVLRAGSQPPSYRLDLIDLRPTSFGQVRARLDLWKGSLKQPVMAAAPGGTMLAVTGNDEFEIFLYPIADLLAGKAEPQRLRGVGATFRYVA
ncbi:MAG: hypothetical protein NZ700_15285, partial [Gemmataceae bacterium]|nr:hypothetical protein [Gemmataceae bacterium]MDW8266186.1 hypothetical protein [Gemmataceae bacterium]